MRISQVLPALSLLFAGSAFCQTPNFAGRWRQAGVTNQTRIENIAHRDSLLTVSFEVRNSISGISGTNEYRTDGTETFRRNAAWQKWITAMWEGASLVVSTVALQGGGVTATRETWTLSSENTLTKVRRTVSARGVEEETLVFERQ